MISNMQQQQNFDGVVINNMINHETSGLCINNNNTNKNKNITPPSSNVMHNGDPNGFNYIAPFTIHSSENAKEYVTPASHAHQEEKGFASLLDEISDLIENHSNGTESAFIKSNSDSHNIMGKETKISHQIVLKEQQPKKTMTPNESHRNAFRYIENVHNYSKLNRSDDSTNSSSPDDDFEDDDHDDDDEDEDDEDADAGNGNKQQEYHKSDGIKKGDNEVKDVFSEKKTILHFTRVPEDDVEEKITPEHHARRPMNAFLIFCKRHRAIVREKYKHLENRSITKILGEWWASLNVDEKTSYTNLAKQYKDAFFSANPNFKWYKLPAPPLRTLSTRPSNTDRPLLASPTNHHNYSITTTNNYETITSSNINKERYNRNTAILHQHHHYHQNNHHHQHYRNESDEETQDASEVGVFKLADEAQMGGLSSLMRNYNTNNNYTVSCLRSPNINVLQNVVTVGTSSHLPLIKEEPFENMKEHAAKVVENRNLLINGKRKSTENENLNGIKRQILFTDNNVSSGEEDIFGGKKSERSCKGKKYQELINSGQIITFTKKTKSKGDNMYSPNTFNHNGYFPHPDSNNYCLAAAAAGKTKTEHYNILPGEEHCKSNPANIIDSPVKQFDASDFDLEDKIKALPAQSLEEYLTRKRETKKKKKINSKRHKPRYNSTTKETPKTIQEAKELIQSQMMMVGSQKRKARKESITRRDITSGGIVVVNDGQSHIFETVDLWNTTIKSESEDYIDKKTNNNNNNSTTSDLLILAEVAANHIEDNV